MSGFQDNDFAGGGGTEGGEQKKQVASISRPDPTAVKATVSEQIAKAKGDAAAIKKGAKSDYASRLEEIRNTKFDAIDEAYEDRLDGVDEAEGPVLEQKAYIRELQRQLRQARIELSAKNVVFKAAKGELKSAYKTAVSGIKSTAAADFKAAKQERQEAFVQAQQAYEAAKTAGKSTVKEEKALLKAYDQWQSDMKWAGRKAGFNAVAQTIVEIINQAKAVYADAAAQERASVPVPESLLKRSPSSDTPTPPQA